MVIKFPLRYIGEGTTELTWVSVDIYDVTCKITYDNQFPEIFFWSKFA